MRRPAPAVLVLETGEVYEGWGWGASKTRVGEVVFNTSMTGYQEVVTDPSYAGQLVVMTYPHVGNTGANSADIESGGIQISGFVIRDLARRPSNQRSAQSLDAYLRDADVPGITGIDTRALTRRIRSGGVVMGILAAEATARDAERLLEELQKKPRYADVNYVARVTIGEPSWVEAVQSEGPFDPPALTFSAASTSEPAPDVVVMDFGVKYSILRNLLNRGLRVCVMPATADASEVLAMSPKVVLLSNGPGDPAVLKREVSTVKDLLGRVPVFGICLGHQLLARALGAETFKLKFGHRGANQPVRESDRGRILITSQNHGYAVAPEGLPESVELTEINCNDGTVEGFRARSLRAQSVQYHPEAGPGPNDGVFFFDRLASATREASA